MTTTLHERQGTGAMREIPPTTPEGRLKAAENRMKALEADREQYLKRMDAAKWPPRNDLEFRSDTPRLDELEHKVATLEKMFERMLELQIAGMV